MSVTTHIVLTRAPYRRRLTRLWFRLHWWRLQDVPAGTLSLTCTSFLEALALAPFGTWVWHSGWISRHVFLDPLWNKEFHCCLYSHWRVGFLYDVSKRRINHFTVVFFRLGACKQRTVQTEQTEIIYHRLSKYHRPYESSSMKYKAVVNHYNQKI